MEIVLSRMIVFYGSNTIVRNVFRVDIMALGGPEIILLIGLALLLFGPDKIPELARSFGQVTSQYKKGLEEAKESFFSDPQSQMSSDERQIINAAKRFDIPTENRSIEEIANDLLQYSNT